MSAGAPAGVLRLLAAAAAVSLGLALAGPGRGPDTVALLAGGALLAPAAGSLAGAAAPGATRARPWRAAVAWLLAPLVPYALVLAWTQALGPRPLPQPWFGLAVVAGLYGLGAGLSVLRRRAPHGAGPVTVGFAGVLLGLALFLAGGPVLFGFAGEGQALARAWPGAAELLLTAAPDGLALETAGFDWSHTNPEVYATSGVEWLQRGPRGAAAAGTTLALGSLGLLAAVRRCRRLAGGPPGDAGRTGAPGPLPRG